MKETSQPTQSIGDRIKTLLLSRSSLIRLSLFGSLVIILLIWKVPQWQAKNIAEPKDRATIENAARGTFVQALGGLFLFITAYFTYQNLKVAQANLKATQDKQLKDAEVAQANLKVAEEKQVTERFAKAIEQVGNASIHVRLGAIYALERISKDSNKDYWQVMEILTAYLRETSPYPPRDKAKNKPLLASILSNQANTTDALKNIPPIGTDIQAVLTVISRRAKSYKQGEEYRLDFSKSNLEGAKLTRANLMGVNFIGANLISANLIGANLIEANLIGANLIGANLMEVNLEGANLEGANLEGANLEGASLIGANLIGANLMEANLIGANLMGANLMGAIFIGVNLSSANLLAAKLEGAKFQTPEQVKSALNWERAKYVKEFRSQLGLPPEPDVQNITC